MTKVFLSYCHDNKSEVARLRDDLLVAGIDVWWDEDIVPGQSLKAAIKRSLESCDKMILCFSRETQARQTAGMYPEARDAIEILRSMSPEASFMIPIRLSECEIPVFQIDAATFLDDLLYVDLFPPMKRRDGIQRLIKAVS